MRGPSTSRRCEGGAHPRSRVTFPDSCSCSCSCSCSSTTRQIKPFEDPDQGHFRGAAPSWWERTSTSTSTSTSTKGRGFVPLLLLWPIRHEQPPLPEPTDAL